MSTATTARVGVAIYKNGSEHAWQFMAGVSSGGGANPQVSTIVYANGSSDYFELYAAQNYTGSVNATSKIMVIYPELTDDNFAYPVGIIKIQNDSDGRGDYIKEWNHPTLARPTDEELA